VSAGALSQQPVGCADKLVGSAQLLGDVLTRVLHKLVVAEITLDLQHGWQPRVEGAADRPCWDDLPHGRTPSSRATQAGGPELTVGNVGDYVEVQTTLRLGLGAPLTLSVSVYNLLDTAYRDFLDTYKGYALSPGRDVQFSLSTVF